MAYLLTNSELSAVGSALDAANSGAAPYHEVYQTILAVLTEPGGQPKDGVDPSVLSWLVGASGVNRGDTLYSDFIREYSLSQYFIRFGQSSTVPLQTVSNNVAKAVAEDILLNGVAPDLNTLGEKDANVTISQYFNGDEGGWSGNPLFIFLGDDSFYQNNIINVDFTGYEFSAFLQSATSAFAATTIGSSPITGFSDVAISFLYMGALAASSMSIAIENNGIDRIAGSLQATNAFIYSLYGLRAVDVAAYTPIFGLSHDGDELYGGMDAEILIGGGGSDIIGGGIDTDIVDGGDGNDVLFGDQHRDRIIGGAGADVLAGGTISSPTQLGSFDLTADHTEWNDGVGDLLKGGMGNDTYLISITEGETWDWAYGQDSNSDNYASLLSIIDTIDEGDGDGVGNILIQMRHPSWEPNEQFQAIAVGGQYAAAEFYPPNFFKSGESLVFLTYIADGSGLLIPHLFVMAGYPLHPVVAIKDFYNGDFGITLDGYSRSRAGGPELLRASEAGDAQTANGSDGAEETITGGRGADAVDYSDSQSGVDVNLSLGTGIGGDADGKTYVSIENVTGSEFADTLTGNAADNYLRGGGGNDVIAGGEGDDIISGGVGNDAISGGHGNDVLWGGDGSDIFSYAQDDGNDIIVEYSDNNSIDQLVVEGFNFDDVFFERRESDLVIRVPGGQGPGGQILITGTLEDDSRGIEQFVFDDWTYSKQDVRSTILSQATTAGNDLIEGFRNTGDYLEGGAGNDTFVFKPEFGWDTIGDFVAGAGTDDVLEFHGGVLADFEAVLAAASQVGNDTIINIDGTNGITLANVNLADLHRDDVRFVA
ncbi:MULTISPECIES: calcium-binding protein [unclassified Rhizobium]|uniref:calcium-binding protein n=1 Tax=unclassified Rhizobium TaxID=2613769 RepID=UPI000BC78D01|nr:MULTISPECIES: calcium-binding protein [unclassified Rhizobium]MDH7810003.1 Ca2+-binding RTX toxin-like protein [Rhizobium sp. AN67]SOD51209.1 hypothetical protein SAMN05216595_0601 [Rhizobium sp. AN6A]